MKATEPNVFDGTAFWERFEHDMLMAKESIIIVSPFVGGYRSRIIQQLCAKVSEDVEITVFTKDMLYQPFPDSARMAFDLLAATNIQIRFAYAIHQKIALIDENVAWTGSLNILSHNEDYSKELMHRFDNCDTSKGVRTHYRNAVRKHSRTEQWALDVTNSENFICEICDEQLGLVQKFGIMKCMRTSCNFVVKPPYGTFFYSRSRRSKSHLSKRFRKYL